MRFIASLLDLVFPDGADARLLRERDADALLPFVRPERLAASRPRTTALMPFSVPLAAAAVRQAKYRDDALAARMLAAALCSHLRETRVENAIFLPMPLSRRRLSERGYNQCERIVRFALDELSDARFTMETGILRRIQDTEHQARLSGRARRGAPLARAFASGTADPHALYVVVDDVITTGATMRAALSALSSAGATRILPVAIAYGGNRHDGKEREIGLG